MEELLLEEDREIVLDNAGVGDGEKKCVDLERGVPDVDVELANDEDKRKNKQEK